MYFGFSLLRSFKKRIVPDHKLMSRERSVGLKHARERAVIAVDGKKHDKSQLTMLVLMRQMG